MERLEAAMIKARAARTGAAATEPKSPVAARTPQAPVAPPQVVRSPSDWETLPQHKVSSAVATKNRLGALMGAELAAPYDVLRTRVLRAMGEQKWTRLGVTSPTKGCGKSTVSLNLALSLARQPELRIVLMDFDLRRPSLAQLLNFPHAEDMSTLLSGSTRFEDHAFRIGRNLAICPNRNGLRNSSELVQSAQTGEVLELIEHAWQPDLLLFDMPPLRGNDDSLAFLGRVDCALIVAAAGATSMSQIETAEKEISAITNVLGTVLNKCRYLDSSESYDANY